MRTKVISCSISLVSACFHAKSPGERDRWSNEKFLQRFYVAGAIEAAHIPNRNGADAVLELPGATKATATVEVTFGATVLAGLFFVVFAVIYLLQLTGVLGGSGSTS